MDYLERAGAPLLMERIAGQSLSSWYPRGLGKLGAQLGAEDALGALTLGPHAELPIAASLPLMSPRLMGETSYLTGRALSPLRHVPREALTPGLYQLGRATSNRSSIRSGRRRY